MMLLAAFTGSTAARPASPSLAAPRPATTLLAPKWLSLPSVDGNCSDAAYTDAAAPTALLLTPAGRPGGTVRVLHSTLDAYLCFTGLTAAPGERVVELAAAWVPALGIDEIAREVQAGLDPSVLAARDLPERHRSLRAVFDQGCRPGFPLLGCAKRRERCT